MVAEARVPEPENPEQYGRFIDGVAFKTPVSDAWEKAEHVMAGLALDKEGKPVIEMVPDKSRASWEAALTDAPPQEIALLASTRSGREKVTFSGAAAQRQVSSMTAQVMPPDISAAYRLCEYYFASEGDVRQTIEIPMDVAIRPVQVKHRDPGVVRLFEQLYSPSYLNIDAMIADIWLSLELYGSAYPYELWDGKPPPDRLELNKLASSGTPPTSFPQEVSCLNPKYVYVGRAPFSGGPALSVIPIGEEGAAFRQGILDMREPMMTYNALSFDIHEMLQWSWNVGLNPGAVTHLRDKSNRFVRYPWPSLMSCFRTLSTRQILEEMIRATIEGTKNQLWFFGLGDAQHRATKMELDQLQGVINGLAGRRTGSLVWGGHLRIEVHSPKVEAELANEKWQRLTEHFFRQRGISLHIVSGENTSTSGGQDATSDNIDVKVFMERMAYKRQSIETQWLTPYTRKICLLSGDPALIKLARSWDLPQVSMGDYAISAESRVKNMIAPLYQMGLTSPQTALSSAGHSYDVELANKKSADMEAFAPPPTFAQTATTASGKTTTSKSQRGQNKTRGEPRTTTQKGRREGTGGQRGKAAAASTEVPEIDLEEEVLS
jgi:hypothetical protein